MATIILNDFYSKNDIEPRDWKIDPDSGYLLAYPRVARTGIQVYGRDEVDPEHEHTTDEQSRVNVYRPPDEVFNKDSMATFPYRTITNDHPRKHVTSKSWKQVSAGAAGGEVARDGEYIRVPLMVCDAPVVEQMDAGKKQFSVGYGCMLDWSPGKTASGEHYDCIQRNIRVNHIAVVDVARGGPELAIDHGDIDDDDDNNEGDDTMAGDSNPRPATLMQMVVDGLNIQVPDMQTQSIINKSMKDRDDKIAALTTDLKSSAANVEKLQKDAAESATKHKEALDKLTAENETLKKQATDAAITPAKLDQMVKDRADTISIATQAMPQGKALVVDGKDIGDIRKQVVLAKMGDVAASWTDAQVETSFLTLTAGFKPVASNDGGRQPFRPGNTVVDAARSFSVRPPAGQMDDAALAYQESDWDTQNMWRGKAYCDANNPHRQRRQNAS